jgi:hypothetical protein
VAVPSSWMIPVASIWLAGNSILLSYALSQLAKLAVLARAQRALDEFFRHEGAAGWTTLLALPMIFGITGGVFGVVVSNLLNGMEHPALYDSQTILYNALEIALAFILTTSLPIWLVNVGRDTTGLNIPAEIHRLSTSPSTPFDKRRLSDHLDMELAAVAQRTRAWVLAFAVLMPVIIAVDIFTFIVVTYQNGRLLPMILVDVFVLAAALLGRLVLLPRSLRRRQGQLCAYRPEIRRLRTSRRRPLMRQGQQPATILPRPL